MSDHSESLMRVLKGIKSHAHKMRGEQLKSRFAPKEPAEEMAEPVDNPEEEKDEHQVTITAGPKHHEMGKSAIHKLLGMKG
jgi:hypothetical protein